MTATLAPTKRNGRPSITNRPAAVCTKPGRPRRALRQLEIANKTAAPAINASAAKRIRFLCMKLRCARLRRAARREACVPKLSWIRQPHKTHDRATRPQHHEKIKKGAEGQDGIKVVLLHTHHRDETEQKKLYVINQQAHGGKTEPARGSAERARPRKAQHCGHQPTNPADNQ